MDNWNTFCDFPEISLIAIRGENVSISRQDNMSMVNSLVKLYLVSIFCVLYNMCPTYIYLCSRKCIWAPVFRLALWFHCLMGISALQPMHIIIFVTKWLRPEWFSVRPMTCTVPYCTSLAFPHAVSAAMWSFSILLTCSLFSLMLGMSLCSKN